MSDARGRVLVVGTPIGNLGDLSPRAVDALAEANVIFCEDTRRTRKLLSAAGVAAPKLASFHQHNEAAACAQALSLASSGATVALVSDAGMPAISDPGQRLVHAAVTAGLPVEVVPGPTALVVALVASGLPVDRFCFEGFLPRRGKERQERLAEIAGERRTCVVYEAPHRARRTLEDLLSVCGPDRQVAVARELTKVHEEVWRGTLEDSLQWGGTLEPRGEWVIVIGPSPAGPGEPISDSEIARAVQAEMEAGTTRRAAVDAVAAAYSLPRRRVYELSLAKAAD